MEKFILPVVCSVLFALPGNATEPGPNHSTICPKASEIKQHIENVRSSQLAELKGDIFAALRNSNSLPLKIDINADSERWPDLDVLKEVKAIALELNLSGFKTDVVDNTDSVVLTVDIK